MTPPPHIGSATRESRCAIAEMAMTKLLLARVGGSPLAASDTSSV